MLREQHDKTRRGRAVARAHRVMGGSHG
jgi:hypothetical protein